MAAPTTNGTTGPFALSRATAADMVELTKLEFACFPPYIREVAMGCRDEGDLPKIRGRYVEVMEQDPSDIWVKVVDVGTGRMVAASNWKIHLNGATEKDNEPILNWLEGEAAEKSQAFMREFEKNRLETMRGVPFIHLHICFTDEKYRRRGAGSLMMKWGCDVADLLGLAGWVEASEEGNFLYKAHGFYEHSRIEGEVPGTNMKRDPKVWAITGGK